MAISIQEFWKLAVASRLLTPDRCRQLHTEFEGLKGARQGNSKSLAQWLVAGGVLSDYQASVLAKGRPGPFVFDEFVIHEQIRQGRLAGLFRATFQQNEQVLLALASKLPTTGKTNSPERLDEMVRRASSVHSPHVTRVYRLIRLNADAFIVIRDLDGRTLADLLAAQRPKLPACCKIGFQVALGLAAMHAQQVVHGAVCPQNIWIDSSGSVKLLQFPLAGGITTSERRAAPWVDYCPPELAVDDCPADMLSDIYGLGCTLYELIAGRVPYPGGTPRQKVTRIASEIPQRLNQIADVPERLAELVAGMMHESWPRCESAERAAEVLATFVHHPRGESLEPPEHLDDEPVAPPSVPDGGWEPPIVEPPVAAAVPGTPPPDASQLPSASAAGSNESAGRVSDAGVAVPDKSAASGTVRDARQPSATRASAERWLGVDSPGFLPDADISRPLPPEMDAFLRPNTPERAAKSKVAMIAVLGLGLAAVVVMSWAFFKESPALPETPTNTEPNTQTPAVAIKDRTSKYEPAAAAAGDATEQASTSPAEAANARERPVEDDGKLLWASPTAGEALSLKYLPPGGQVFIVLRPADLLRSGEGPKLLAALGPAGDSAVTRLKAILRVDPADIEQLTIAFFSTESEAPQTAYVLRLTNKADEDALAQAWGKPASREAHRQRYLAGADMAYYLPTEEAGRVVALMPPAAMEEMLAVDGRPALRKGIERLLRHSDTARHVTILANPSYLFTDGQTLLDGELASLRRPLNDFLGDGVEAVSASAHLGDELFLEFRALGTLDNRPGDVVETFRGRLDRTPDQLQQYVKSLASQAYGRSLIDRFPQMLQVLTEYTRRGVEDGQVVMRCYLPRAAAHNLLMATELTLAAETSADRPPARSPVAAASAQAALQKTISLGFPRETLDRCLELFAKEVELEVVILGRDLQAEGITQNQQLALDERERPAGQVLRKVLAMADPSGRLVYVIRPAADGREAIFITTRSAADKRGEQLPAEFVKKTPS